MSSSSEICTEVTDPDTQFNNGIKMIVSAYETQTSFLSNEITRLNKELSLRDSKIKKMDELCSSLLKEKSEYEAKVNSLSTINRSLSLQIETLRAENNSLKKVKDKIRETIEVDKITPNDISLKYYRADDGSLFENNHWYRAFGKISIFNLETFNKIVYLDSDMQVVQNIDELFDKPHMSAVRAGEDLDWLNSGIMVIEPNSTEFNKLLEIVYNNEDATIYFICETDKRVFRKMVEVILA